MMERIAQALAGVWLIGWAAKRGWIRSQERTFWYCDSCQLRPAQRIVIMSGLALDGDNDTEPFALCDQCEV